MGWANALVLTGLTFIVVWVLIELRAMKKPPFVKYKDVSAPGCFKAGRDVNDRR